MAIHITLGASDAPHACVMQVCVLAVTNLLVPVHGVCACMLVVAQTFMSFTIPSTKCLSGTLGVRVRRGDVPAGLHARPSTPPSAPADLADLVRACWHQTPTHRLTFDQILARISGAHHVATTTTCRVSVVAVTSFSQSSSDVVAVGVVR